MEYMNIFEADHEKIQYFIHLFSEPSLLNLSRVQKGGLENLAHVNEGEYLDSNCLRNYLSHKNLIYVQQLPDCVAQNNIGSFVLFCIIDLDLNSCWEPGQAGTKKRLILVNMQVEFQAVFYWVFRSMVKFLVLS